MSPYDEQRLVAKLKVNTRRLMWKYNQPVKDSAPKKPTSND